MIDYEKPILNKNGQPIRILMAAHHGCIRVMKIMRAMIKLGYQIDGLSNRVSYGCEDFDFLAVWQNERQFKNYIRDNIHKYDIIYWANEPDYQAKWIRDVINSANKQDQVKLVVDLHDLDSIRRHIIPLPEREMFNSADGLIYVSKPIQKMSNELHKVTIPNTVLYSYCNKDIVNYDINEISKRRGLIYEGGANPPNDDLANREFAYRNLYEIMSKLVEMGNETHMFCGNITAYHTYQNTGAILYPPTHYDKMMKELTKFKYGIVSFNNKDGQKDQVNFTLTNKFFEYAIAGVIPLACWCPETEKLVNKWKVGFTFKDIEEIKDCKQLETKYEEIMSNINDFNKKVYMENFIWKLENLYAEVLGVEKKSIPDNIKNLDDFEMKE